jgi:hypothetical protein
VSVRQKAKQCVVLRAPDKEHLIVRCKYVNVQGVYVQLKKQLCKLKTYYFRKKFAISGVLGIFSGMRDKAWTPY